MSRGPAPKPAHLRRRRNRVAGARVFLVAPTTFVLDRLAEQQRQAAKGRGGARAPGPKKISRGHARKPDWQAHERLTNSWHIEGL